MSKPQFSRGQLSSVLLEMDEDAIIGTDPNGAITNWSRGAERMYGYTSRDSIGQLISFLFAPDTAEESTILIDKLARSESVSHFETVHVRRDSKMINVSMSFRPIVNRTKGVLGHCIVAREITKEKNLAIQIRQVQKMEAVGRLAGGVAHDFNNLLTVISGYNNIVLAELPTGNPLWECASEVHAAAERASALTRQLLAFSRRQVSQPQVIDLTDTVRDMEKMLRRIVGEDIAIILCLAPGLNKVKADPGQIGQVMMNLAANARDAMPKGGTLTITTSNVALGERVDADGNERQSGAYVQISIRDNGTGIDEETQEHLFEPFFTTKSKTAGTGLGLSIVHGIVAQHGGEILVSSAVGQGTEFKILLPLAPEEQVTEKAHKATYVASMAAPGETILLVEDEDGVRRLVEKVLRQQGYTVYQTSDIRESFRIFQSVKIHLLVTDMVMREMNGTELASKLLQIDPFLKVLYMSGYVDEPMLGQGLLTPGVNFIQKPFSIEDINRMVGALLQHSSSVSHVPV